MEANKTGSNFTNKVTFDHSLVGVSPCEFYEEWGDVQDDMESEEDVEVVFDETTNLRSSTIMGDSTYTALDASKT
ncbi:hypothetical protein Tco_1136786 [Tanacetum coccineum]